MSSRNTVISQNLVTHHGLSADEYKKIVEVLGREPNLVELGMLYVVGGFVASIEDCAAR